MTKPSFTARQAPLVRGSRLENAIERSGGCRMSFESFKTTCQTREKIRLQVCLTIADCGVAALPETLEEDIRCIQATRGPFFLNRETLVHFDLYQGQSRNHG